MEEKKYTFNPDTEENNKKTGLNNRIIAIVGSVLIVIIIGILGIPTSSVIAAISAAGLAIGLALQGSLSNLAGGIILAVTKPFKLDDYIESSGVSGTVEDMKLFYTELITPDNKVVMVPNGKLANDTIINYSILSKKWIQ